MSLTRGQALGDVLLSLALLGVSGVAALSLAPLLGAGRQIPALMLIQGLLLLGGLRALLGLRGQRWRCIGFRSLRPIDLARGVVAFASALGANLLFTTALFLAAPEAVQGHIERLGVLAGRLGEGIPAPALVALLCFVGVYEELFARGFLLRRCQAALGGAWGPVVVSSFLFGLGHAYQGWIGVAQTALVGAVLAAYTLRWGALWPAIIAHALLNIASIVLIGAAGEDP